MRYIKILFIIVCYFAYSSNVLADLCDKEHIKELKELANKVDVNYEYIVDEDEDGDGEITINVYSVDVNLLSNELYLSDGKKEYYFNDFENGIVNLYYNASKINFDIHSTRCFDYKLRTISIDLPKYNTYSYKSECKELSEYELDVCDPWYQGTINDNYFDSVVNKYLNIPKEKETIIDILINFYNKYQLIIIGSILLIVLVIIGIVSYRKRSVLE